MGCLFGCPSWSCSNVLTLRLIHLPCEVMLWYGCVGCSILHCFSVDFLSLSPLISALMAFRRSLLLITCWPCLSLRLSIAKAYTLVPTRMHTHGGLFGRGRAWVGSSPRQEVAVCARACTGGELRRGRGEWQTGIPEKRTRRVKEEEGREKESEKGERERRERETGAHRYTEI